MVKLLIPRLCQNFVFCLAIRINRGGTTHLNSKWKGEHQVLESSKYTTYSGNGDTRSFQHVVNANPYPGKTRNRYEGVGCVQERITTHINTLRQEYKRFTLQYSKNTHSTHRTSICIFFINLMFLCFHFIQKVWANYVKVLKYAITAMLRNIFRFRV